MPENQIAKNPRKEPKYGPPGSNAADPLYHLHRKHCAKHGPTTWDEYEAQRAARHPVYGPPGGGVNHPGYGPHRHFCFRNGWTPWPEFLRRVGRRSGQTWNDAPPEARQTIAAGASQSRRPKRHAKDPTCTADIRAIAQLNHDIVNAKLAEKGLRLPPYR